MYDLKSMSYQELSDLIHSKDRPEGMSKKTWSKTKNRARDEIESRSMNESYGETRDSSNRQSTSFWSRVYKNDVYRTSLGTAWNTKKHNL